MAVAIEMISSLCVTALLGVLILCLGRHWSMHLMGEAIAVYGGLELCPRMRWAERWFVLWFGSHIAALWVLMPDSPQSMMVWVLWLAMLGLAALVDARTGLLPNELTLPIMASGLVWQSVANSSFVPPESYAWGVVLGWFLPTLLNWLHERWRATVAIGQGDARLLAGIGAWLGLQALPLVWVLACLTVLVYTALVWVAGHERPSHVTFGPFLAMGASITMVLNHV